MLHLQGINRKWVATRASELSSDRDKGTLFVNYLFSHAAAAVFMKSLTAPAGRTRVTGVPVWMGEVDPFLNGFTYLGGVVVFVGYQMFGESPDALGKIANAATGCLAKLFTAGCGHHSKRFCLYIFLFRSELDGMIIANEFFGLFFNIRELQLIFHCCSTQSANRKNCDHPVNFVRFHSSFL